MRHRQKCRRTERTQVHTEIHLGRLVPVYNENILNNTGNGGFDG